MCISLGSMAFFAKWLDVKSQNNPNFEVVIYCLAGHICSEIRQLYVQHYYQNLFLKQCDNFAPDLATSSLCEITIRHFIA